MKIAGWEIKRSSDELENDDERKLQSFAEPLEDDGALMVDAMPSTMLGTAYGISIDLDGTAKSEGELVFRYRQMAQHPECRRAIDDIINEAIILDDDAEPITIDVDQLKYSSSVKTKIRDEFNSILKLLDFNNNAYEHFFRWYVDGRYYLHVIIDHKNHTDGIQELRYVDARKIRKVKEIITEVKEGVQYKRVKDEYYVYSEDGFGSVKRTDNKSGVIGNQMIRIAKDGIVHCTSGLVNEENTMVLSHLHKALKPLNQLRILEDSVVVYRVSRAPERLVFYIDVGNLPKAKAEQYMNQMMTNYKNKLIYNSATGEISDQRRHMSMLDNFWLARREGGRGTEIQPLQGGANLGEIEDILYFQKKLYHSLDVPISRMDTESANFSLGRPAEITRDEIKFSKFIHRLRSRFTSLFDELLKRQLILKNIITLEEWEDIKNDIKYVFSEDNHFEELKQVEVWRERGQLANDYEPFAGVYISRKWVKKNIFRFSDDEIKEMEKEIEEEKDQDQDEMEEVGIDPSMAVMGGRPQMPMQPNPQMTAAQPTPTAPKEPENKQDNDSINTKKKKPTGDKEDEKTKGTSGTS